MADHQPVCHSDLRLPTWQRLFATYDARLRHVHRHQCHFFSFFFCNIAPLYGTYMRQISPRTSLNFNLLSVSEAQKVCDDTCTDGFHLGRNTVPLPSIHIQNIDRESLLCLSLNFAVVVSAEWISIFRVLLAPFLEARQKVGKRLFPCYYFFSFLFSFCLRQSRRTFVYYRQELDSNQVVWRMASRKITDGPLCQLLYTNLGMWQVIICASRCSIHDNKAQKL